MTAERGFQELDNESASTRRAVVAERILAKRSADVTGPLAGWTFLVKDNIDVAGCSTRAGATFLETVRPGPHQDAEVVRRACSLGMTPVGKTQLNEFAYGLDGANAHFGDCPHPHLKGYCAGGSSSGSAYAVARGWVPLAFGTDTGGSIRVPAAFCGLYGFRLPPDRWACDGCVPLAPSYDSVGWFTRSLPEMDQATRALLELPLEKKSLRIGFCMEGSSSLTAEVQRLFPDAVPVESPAAWGSPAERVHAYNVLQSLEALEVHRDWIGPFADAYDPATYRRIVRAREWTSETVEAAGHFEEALCRETLALFNTFDVLMMPVHPAPTPRMPMSDDLRSELLAHTVPASMAGLPVLTLPVMQSDGRSRGIQCIIGGEDWRSVLSRLFSRLQPSQAGR